jgi:hypothetical protein
VEVRGQIYTLVALLYGKGPPLTLCKVRHNIIEHFLGALAKNCQKATISFVMSPLMSVRLRGTIRLSLDGVSWNLVFEDFAKICLDILIVINIGQE